MPQAIKQLGQVSPLAATDTTLYTAPASTSAIVSVKVAHTGSTDPVTFEIFNDDDGTVATSATAIAWVVSIRPGETKTYGGIHMGENQGTIRVRNSAAELTFTAYGVEFT